MYWTLFRGTRRRVWFDIIHAARSQTLPFLPDPAQVTFPLDFTSVSRHDQLARLLDEDCMSSLVFSFQPAE